MIIVLVLHLFVIWLVFFKLKLLPWNLFSKLVVVLTGVAILLTFVALLNARAPSGRITVMSPVVEVAPMVNGTVVEILVTTHQAVGEGDTLFRLDPRPFEYALKHAQAQHKIADIIYRRLKTAVAKNFAAANPQKVDETRAKADATAAAQALAQYNLDRAEARIWGVFPANAGGAVKVGAKAAIAFSSEPGVVYRTKVISVAPGTAGGQVSANAQLIGQGDIGNTGEVIAVLAWPDGVQREAVTIGGTGIATVFRRGRVSSIPCRCS